MNNNRQCRKCGRKESTHPSKKCFTFQAVTEKKDPRIIYPSDETPNPLLEKQQTSHSDDWREEWKRISPVGNADDNSYIEEFISETIRVSEKGTIYTTLHDVIDKIETLMVDESWDGAKGDPDVRREKIGFNDGIRSAVSLLKSHLVTLIIK